MPKRQTITLAIIFAMEAEALPFIKKLNFSPVQDNTLAPVKVFQSDFFEGATCYLFVNGQCRKHGVDRVGTQSSAITAWEVIKSYAPNLIINAGTAGGFKSQGAEIADVYLSDDFIYYHDRRIPLPQFDQYGEGAFPSISTRELAADLNLKQGVISSGNSLDMTDEDLKRIQSKFATIKEMEAAAIAEVAHEKAVPFLAVKSITDLIDSAASTPDEFLKNFEEANQTLSTQLEAIIHTLLAKPHFFM